jgi:hypothetical protein
MKVGHAPTDTEVARLDDYIRFTLYGIKVESALGDGRLGLRLLMLMLVLMVMLVLMLMLLLMSLLLLVLFLVLLLLLSCCLRVICMTSSSSGPARWRHRRTPPCHRTSLCSCALRTTETPMASA